MKFVKKKIVTLLKRNLNSIQVDDATEYKQVTIRTKYKGVTLRGLKVGNKIGTKRQVVVKGGQFILSRIDARHGAFGIIPDSLEGAIVTNDFWAFDIDENEILLDLFYILLRSPLFLDACIKASKGVTNRRRIQKDFFLNYELNIPEKIEEQRFLCDKIKKGETSLNELKDYFKSQLTDLKSLRQAILQEAIQGKLVVQNPDDEPAEQLLQRIQKEKARLVAEKKIKREKVLPPISEAEKPFELPKGWVWCRLRTLAKHVVDCPHSTPKFQENGWNCLDTKSMNQGEIIYEKIRKVSEEDFIFRQKRLKPEADDIVYSREGTIGLAVIVPKNFEFCLGQRVMIFRTHKEVIPKYFRFALISKVFVRQWESKLTGATSKHVNIKDLKQMLIPLPPLPEQIRIVAKVEQLLQLVSDLEAQVTMQQADVGRLMQGVLQEAFK